MKSIARDEIGHAALAWGVARWAESRLTEAEMARLDRAKMTALCRLELEIDRSLDASGRRLLGWPGPARYQALVRGFRSKLFA